MDYILLDPINHIELGVIMDKCHDEGASDQDLIDNLILQVVLFCQFHLVVFLGDVKDVDSNIGRHHVDIVWIVLVVWQLNDALNLA